MHYINANFTIYLFSFDKLKLCIPCLLNGCAFNCIYTNALKY